jgi:hypothetical protein
MIVPRPSFQMRGSRCWRVELRFPELRFTVARTGFGESRAAIVVPIITTETMPTRANPSEAVNTKAISVNAMPAIVRRRERMLCIVVTFRCLKCGFARAALQDLLSDCMSALRKWRKPGTKAA